MEEAYSNPDSCQQWHHHHTDSHAVRRVAKTLAIDLGGKGMTGVDGSPSANELLKTLLVSRKTCACLDHNAGEEESEDEGLEGSPQICVECKGLQARAQEVTFLEQHCICCDKQIFKSDNQDHPCTGSVYSTIGLRGIKSTKHKLSSTRTSRILQRKDR